MHLKPESDTVTESESVPVTVAPSTVTVGRARPPAAAAGGGLCHSESRPVTVPRTLAGPPAGPVTRASELLGLQCHDA